MRNLLLLICLASLVAVFSCKKKDLDGLQNGYSKTASSQSNESFSTLSSGTCIEDTSDPNRYDSIPGPTILGYHLVNHPYSLAHMQQAYLNLYGSSSGVTVTHKYVRFKPSDPQQLSTLEDLDIDLFDYPLDYDVVQTGDYYDDGVTPAEEIPWLYAVVATNFTPPAGITYEVLEQIHVPTLAAVENEAFRITGNPYDDPNCGALVPNAATSAQTTTSAANQGGKKISPQRAGECPVGYTWDPILRQCVRDQTPPPPPAPARQPSGTITVEDINFPGTGPDHFRPVRNARVVAKRWLKIERTYTNNAGQFFITKEFNKVHVSVKFKNDQAKIRALRRARLWQVLFEVERNVGTFKGGLNNIFHIIPYAKNALTGGARDWAAATGHNTVQEYYEFAGVNNIGTPPGGIKILLSNWHHASGSTPMFAKRAFQELPEDFLRFYLFGSATYSPPLANLAYLLKKEIDITVGYNSFFYSNDPDFTRDPSNLSEIMFHELTHAARYNKVGNSWWNDFVSGELNNIILPWNENPPYGEGDQGATSDIIGLGESWAYHMGHFMADWKYGVNSSCTAEQVDAFGYAVSYCPDGISHPQIEVLEQYNPNLSSDPDGWIPKGLYLDLIDTRNEFLAPITDGVSGYTNEQFFNALDADIRSIPSFRIRLLSENGNNQATAVTNLFDQYHY